MPAPAAGVGVAPLQAPLLAPSVPPPPKNNKDCQPDATYQLNTLSATRTVASGEV